MARIHLTLSPVHPYVMGGEQVLRRGAFRSIPPPSSPTHASTSVLTRFCAGGKYVAYGVTDVAAPGTLNLLPVVGAFARLAWQQNVASFFDSKGARARFPYPPHRVTRIPYPQQASHGIHLVLCSVAPPRGGVFQRGGGARQVAGPLRQRPEGSHRPRGGQTTRPRWVILQSLS